MLRKDRILFFFFKGGARVAVAVKVVVTVRVRVGAAKAVRVVAVLIRAVTATKGRFITGVEETVFSRIRLLRFT